MAAPLPVICLAGPTGCGKTAAALALAEALGGEVINADSRQVYSDFPLITAQPSPEEQACCPHHLYGFLPTEQKISAGRWADQAVAEAKAVLARGHVPLLVGGTGLYFQGLLHGIAEIPAIDPAITAALTARLAEEGPAALHAELAAKDPAYAARIHPNDRQRIVRALEVLAGTGHTFSWWHEHGMPEPPCAGPLLVLDMELDALTPCLARRIDLMLEQGALDEARAARRRCDDAAAPRLVRHRLRRSAGPSARRAFPGGMPPPLAAQHPRLCQAPAHLVPGPQRGPLLRPAGSGRPAGGRPAGLLNRAGGRPLSLPSRQTDHGTMPGTAAVWCFFHARTEVLPRGEQGPASGAPFDACHKRFLKIFLDIPPVLPSRPLPPSLPDPFPKQGQPQGFFPPRSPFSPARCPNTSVQVSFSARDLP